MPASHHLGSTRRRLPAALFLVFCLLLAGLAGGPTARGQEPTPTPTATPASEEVATELPPPDLPTANEQGYTFDLDTKLNVDLDAVIKEAPVYRLLQPEITLQEAQGLADLLGIGAQVEDRGDGTYLASGNGQLFVSADLIQYFTTATGEDGDLPDDATAVEKAKDWLRTSGLMPPDIGAGEVVGRTDEGKRVIVVFGPAEPQNVLSAIPSITVTLGGDSVVIETSIRWPNVVRFDIYQLLPAKQAWQIIQSGQAFLETDLTDLEIEPGTEVKGTATFSSVTIAYATSGPPGGDRYLQPVYVFAGKLKVDDEDKRVDIIAYVPALANSGAPVG